MVFKRNPVSIIYICISVAIIVFMYYCLWIPNLEHLLCANDESYRGAEKKSPFDSQGESGSCDQVFHYILHPQAPCKTSAVVGGQIMTNKKLDGDKIVCLDPGPGFGEECIVYSFGINYDWSFDDAMHNKFGCRVYSFDPSMDMPDHLHSEGVWFYNQGIGRYNIKIPAFGQIWKLKTLDSIIDQLNHTGKTIDLLKMDIEGAEWRVLEDIMNKGLLNHVNHLCLEMHLMANPYWTQVLNIFRRIEESGLKHFSTRNNTQWPKIQVPGVPERYEQHFFEMAWYRH